MTKVSSDLAASEIDASQNEDVVARGVEAPQRSLPLAKARVSILIPCLNEEAHIERVVRQALGQSHPKELVEVLVADGGSSDATRAILARLRRLDERLLLMSNPARIQAAALNAMIRRSTGEVLVRMDAHADYPSDYVERCLRALGSSGAAVVGGAQRISARSAFQQAIGDAMTSPLGMGAAAYRDPSRRGWVDTVYLGAFRRAVFEQAGLYDASAATNEDAELNQRILATGGRIWLCSDIVVHYRPRESWRALLRQYLWYGFGRARTLLKHRRLPTPRPLAPFFALLVFAVLFAVHRPALVPLVLTYVTLTTVEAFRVAGRGGAAHALRTWALFPLIHAAHGAGFAAGLVRFGFAPNFSPDEFLPRRKAAP